LPLSARLGCQCGSQERAFVRKIQTLEMNTDQVDRQNILITGICSSFDHLAARGTCLIVVCDVAELQHDKERLQEQVATLQVGLHLSWRFNAAHPSAVCFSLCSRARRSRMSASKWPWRPISRTRFARLLDILVGWGGQPECLVFRQKLREELYGKEGDVSAARRHAEENEHKLKQVGLLS
jgi:hypothetical protein